MDGVGVTGAPVAHAVGGRVRRGFVRTAVCTSDKLTTGPIVRRSLVALGSVEVPTQRSSHSAPVVRGGGVARVVGTGVDLLVTDAPVPGGATVAAGGMALLGLVDDQTGGLSPVSRLTVCVFGSGPTHGRSLIDRTPVPSVPNWRSMPKKSSWRCTSVGAPPRPSLRGRSHSSLRRLGVRLIHASRLPLAEPDTECACLVHLQACFYCAGRNLCPHRSHRSMKGMHEHDLRHRCAPVRQSMRHAISMRDEPMRPERGSASLGQTAAIAALATAALGGPVRMALLRWGTMDVPNHRSSHAVPVVRSGGIATLLGAGVASLLTGRRPGRVQGAAVLALAGLGLADDISGDVPARLRLATQLILGAAPSAHAGWDRPVAGVGTAGVVNVVNFMDGINGITGMAAAVWGVNAMLLEDESDGNLATLGALTAGAGLGFLPHNVPTARMFLGDVGSYAFGAAMAAGILSQRSVAGRYRAAAPLMLYGVDAAQALLRRANAGEPLTEPHRGHVYQRLVDGGWSHLEVAVLHAVLAGIVAASSHRGGVVAWTVGLAVAVGYLTLPHKQSCGSLIAQPPPNCREGTMTPVHPDDRSRVTGDLCGPDSGSVVS